LPYRAGLQPIRGSGSTERVVPAQTLRRNPSEARTPTCGHTRQTKRAARGGSPEIDGADRVIRLSGYL
jgi:hypothetical protein